MGAHPCRSACKTGPHETFGACCRAANIEIDKHGLQNRDLEKDKDRRLSRYEDARRAGLQPASTDWKDVRSAFETGGTDHTEVTTGG